MEASAGRSGAGRRAGSARSATERIGRMPRTGRWRAATRPSLPDEGELQVYRALLEPGADGDGALPRERPDALRGSRRPEPEAADLDHAFSEVVRSLLAEILGVSRDEAPPEGRPGGSMRIDLGAAGVRRDGAASLYVDATRAGSMVLLAAGRTGALGVDVERLRSLEELEREPAPLSEVERETLCRLPPGLRPEAYLQCRTRKQALRKAAPERLAGRLRDLDVSLTPGAPARIHRWRRDGADAGGDRPGDWTLVHLRPAPGYIGAVALRGEADVVRLRTLEGR